MRGPIEREVVGGDDEDEGETRGWPGRAATTATSR
jgi:hypothetical protein